MLLHRPDLELEYFGRNSLEIFPFYNAIFKRMKNDQADIPFSHFVWIILYFFTSLQLNYILE